MEKSIYEKHIASLEDENRMLKDTLNKLKAQTKFVEKNVLAEKGESLKRSVLFLNTIYGRLGEIQAALLNELNVLNNDNLIITNERIVEAVKLVTNLLPLNPKNIG